MSQLPHKWHMGVLGKLTFTNREDLRPNCAHNCYTSSMELTARPTEGTTEMIKRRWQIAIVEGIAVVRPGR